MITVFSITPTNAQSEAQVKAELEKRGIDTKEEILSELRKRGMTEDDARRQAKVYGLDYDEYIRKYISGSETTDSTPKNVQEVSTDTVKYTSGDQIIKQAETQPTNAPVTAQSTSVKYFGYSIFNNNPYANQGALVGNIDPGYLIGPGDELRVYLWGEAEFQFEGKVDINGNLFIPNVGQVFVSGTTYENLNVRMKEYLSKFYSGLKKNPPKIFLDVSLTKLRPIRIMVMGESNKPGSHLINAFATTMNSLYVSGGIKISGSLREIKVFRNNRYISTMDLYDYLIKGTAREDIRLVSNDVVFIPSRKNSITLLGEVNKEAIFELKDNEGLIDLISFAGGLRPTAYTESVTIKRIKSISDRDGSSNFDREIININYKELIEQGVNYKLQDGDIITFDKVLEDLNNVVNIEGSVFRPGEYQLNETMNLKDLIMKAGGIRPNTYLDKVDLFRVDENGDLKFRTFSLSSILNSTNGAENIVLQRQDSLKVYNENEVKSLESVSISGFAADPITMPWRENLSLYDLIFMSANIEDLDFQNRILTSRADLFRYQEGKIEYQVVSFDLDSVLNKQFDVVLRPKDQVILYSRDITEVLEKYVSVQGAVKNGGRFRMTEEMNVEDLLIQAGGFLEKSFQDSVTITREFFDFSGNEIATNQRVKVDKDYLLGLKSASDNNDFLLKHNDRINVDLIPGSAEGRSVVLEGEVKFPGTYYLESKGETLSSVIRRAGGLSPNVYLPGAKFFRNGQQLAFSFEKLFEERNSKFDITVNDNDRIVFPESVFTVQVGGQVVNPSLQKYISGKGVRTYVRNAGGKTKEGRKIYITEPTGFTRKVGWFANPRVLDGSIITVSIKPPKPERQNNGKFLETFGTLAAIISSSLTAVFLAQRIAEN
ncbi:SLBB domain-containing protein [Roseivirga misakiensis]|uniref:SLBB domain-containing protein n=1 Tax=Roseivirga misakiensis TaxID=1563681 RepID=UPI000B0A0D1A|nr:SLBB domain-containing protein [Roseivirga misakiensis]